MDNLLYILLVANFLLCLQTIKAANDIEPPFPQIISPLQVNKHRLHIVSESVSEKGGYETFEEFVDLDEGKNTIVRYNKVERQVTHVDGMNNLLFQYKPYTCAAVTPNEVELELANSLWVKKFSINSGDTTKEMHLFGVTALWMNAAEKAKSYSTSNLIYSASKDVYKSAHKWSVKDDENKFQTHLYFIDNSARSNGNKLSLEMIQIESLVSMKIVQTMNILSFEYSFSDSDDSLMRVPVGYGCINSEVTSKALTEFPNLETLYLGPLIEDSHKIQLEATATKFEQTNEGVQRSSDTISYEIAHTSPNYWQGDKGLQLIRHRDTKKDVKIISNYQFNVEYRIDMRKGTCELSNMAKYGDANQGEQLSLEFNNGLKLAIQVETFKDIFVNTDGFFFIARAKKQIEYLYFEKTTDKMFGGRNSRIIRTYSTNQAATGEVRLESVTIWVFDDTFENIIESYHLNVIDAMTLNGILDVPRTFDISEECYLNNENMVPGKDYVWFELHYPVSARYNQVLASKAMELKRLFRFRFIGLGSNLFLAPRMEIMFEDTGFILRVLQIDVPSLSYLYELKEGTILSIDKTSGDAEDLTVDLNHCTDLCRLSNCKAMSYCENDHLCLISNSLPDNDKHKMVKNKSCMTYKRPVLNLMDKENDKEFENIEQSRLQRVVGELQHQDYDAISVPKAPDELSYPRGETGIDDATYKKISQSYGEELSKFFETSGHRSRMLIITTVIEEATVILMPNKFELEQDPLNEFTLADKDSSLVDDLDSSGKTVVPFHEGLTMHRFKIHAFNEGEKNTRSFIGLNYDQCALACVDSRCSSFSFCTHRQECVLTDIYTIGDSMNNIIEVDSDCMIMQRDFLSKFNKFQNVIRPDFYKSSSNAFNPTECAHSCVIETGFNCLAFDFCSTDSSKSSSQINNCFLLEDRQIFTGIGSLQKDNNSSAIKQTNGDFKTGATGCDHYSRSYLADFLRIEYRQMDDKEMLKLKTSVTEGHSVDQCADECVNQLNDCTAFQFCFDPDVREGAMQKCTFIESKPEAANDGIGNDVVLDEKDGFRVVKASKLFVPNGNCHVFSLRHDASEAHLRELALNGMTKEEMEANEERKKVLSSGLSVGGGVLLYLSVTVIFAAIGCGMVLIKHHNHYVGQKIERIQLLLGI